MLKTTEEIMDLVTCRIMTEFQRLQSSAGIYKIIYDPEDDKVYVTSTFSGDNSYIPNDSRICLIEADIRESISNSDLGLDDEGDVVENDTYQFILDQIESNLERDDYDL